MFRVCRSAAVRCAGIKGPLRLYATLFCLLCVAHAVSIVAESDIQNPLLAPGLPDYPTITADHVVPGVKEALAAAEAEVRRLEENGAASWSGLMEPLERACDKVSNVWQTVQTLLHVRNAPALRSAQEEVQPQVVQFMNRLAQSQALYRGYRALQDSAEFSSLTQPQRRVVDLAVTDARLAGVALEDESRAEFNKLAEELAALSTKFQNNVLDATNAFALRLTTKEEVEGLPPSMLGLAAQVAVQKGDAGATPDDGPWVITLQQPLMEPFLKFSRRRDLRRHVYTASITRASSGATDNSGVLQRILAIRARQAAILGFPTFGEMRTSNRMAGNVSAAEALLLRLRTVARPVAFKDHRELEQVARESGTWAVADTSAPGATEERAWNTENVITDSIVAPWDVAFWSNVLREKRHALNEEELRQYFQLPKVLDGLFGVVERLFNVKVVSADGEAPVWHPDVRFFRVMDTQGTTVASFFLDPYARPDKHAGAWMDGIRGRSKACAPAGETVRLPVAYMACSGSPPVGGTPSLMSFRDVATLFHEFGHALQHMLTTVDEGDVSGIAHVEWDAVELASQFMENWCYHPPTLRGMTAHVKTGEPLSDKLIERIIAARDFREGSATVRQAQFALTDLRLHHHHAPGTIEPMEVYRQVAAETLVTPVVPEDRMLCSFSHIFGGGYAAGYYGYKWAEVLSADAFGAFEEAGIDNDTEVRLLGKLFRDTVLSLGGSVPAMDVFKRFRGREPSPEALLKHCR